MPDSDSGTWLFVGVLVGFSVGVICGWALANVVKEYQPESPAEIVAELTKAREIAKIIQRI